MRRCCISNDSREVDVLLPPRALTRRPPRTLRLRQLKPEIGGPIENQAEVLVHQAERERDRVFVSARVRELCAAGCREHNQLFEPVQESLAVEADSFAERDRLGHGLHLNAKHCVDDKLHLRARAQAPMCNTVFAIGASDGRLSSRRASSAPTSKTRSPLRLLGRFGHREVKHTHLESGTNFDQLARQFSRRTTQIRKQAACRQNPKAVPAGLLGTSCGQGAESSAVLTRSHERGTVSNTSLRRLVFTKSVTRAKTRAMIVVLVIFLFICLVAGATAVLGAPGLLLLPVGVLVVVGLLVGGVVGSGRSSRQVLRERPKAELLGPGGPDDPDAGKTEPLANDPDTSAPQQPVSVE